MKTVNWGIIGCGQVTELKSGPAFNQVEGSRLVAVMRRDATAAEDYAKRHAVPKWYVTARDLIHDPEVNAVYIATPPNAHAELALEVAASGKPCYVEKPMARTAEECRQMIEGFSAKNLPLFVAYYRRALPHFSRVKALIESSELGALRQLNYDFASPSMLGANGAEGWRFDPEIAGGGLFWDLGSHALDLFDFWMGPLKGVEGQLLVAKGGGAVEELVSMSAHTAEGVSITGAWNFISRNSADVVTLRFSAGEIRCSVFGPPEVEITDSAGDTRTETFQLPENIQLPLISNIVKSLREGAVALSTGASARRTNEVIDAVAAHKLTVPIR
jgi:1,5-anhydro-D-fructose reductase (1,5-anhydro-D-mannitol-forming)